VTPIRVTIVKYNTNLYYCAEMAGSNQGWDCVSAENEQNLKKQAKSQAFHKNQASHNSSVAGLLAPGVGFEPARPRRATGSQGLRIIHSAHGKRDTGLLIIPACFSGTIERCHLTRFILKYLLACSSKSFLCLFSKLKSHLRFARHSSARLTPAIL
jgi:hypothetical protein